MKSITSEKARNEIGKLVTELSLYSEWTSTGVTKDVNFRYFWARKCECIVKLQEIYGIPSIHYETSKATLVDPAWTEATYTKGIK